jgi:predicted transposase/invertase (TIGR01784 family)
MEENNNVPHGLNNPHDKFFKGTFGMKKVARAFTEAFVDKDLLEDLDLDSLEIDSTTYITDELSEFFADMVWRCYYKKGNEYVKISFLYEHKSYIPAYPHFQLLDYLRGGWRTQILQENNPILMIPIILYHGESKWINTPLQDYFGKVHPKFLRFLPCFDYILVDLQNYSDKVIQAFDSIFLQKTLLSFKHHLDKEYFKTHNVELIWIGYHAEKKEEIRSFIRMITVYLSSISDMSSRDIEEAAKNHPNHIIKSEAMSLVDELFERGLSQGLSQGMSQGITKGVSAIKYWQKGMSIAAIAKKLDLPIVEVKTIIDNFKSDN